MARRLGAEPLDVDSPVDDEGPPSEGSASVASSPGSGSEASSVSSTPRKVQGCWGAGVRPKEAQDDADSDDSSDSREPDTSRSRAALSEGDFRPVLRAERRLIEAKMRGQQRHAGAPGGLDGADALRFSVAFSGGGVRAASFESGVLWRLAQRGLLRHVEYVSADSGGTYMAAAFASHVLEAREPPAGQSADDWYLALVAKTLCRMQANMPYLARDVTKTPFAVPADGSSRLPRVFDIPLLFIVTSFTMVFTPLSLFVNVLVPAGELLNMFVGGAMRRYFCEMSVDFLIERDKWVAECALGSVLVTFVVWLFSRSAFCRPRRRTRRGHMTLRRNACWLCGQSATSAALRLTSFALFIAVALLMVLVLQQILYNLAEEQRDFRHRKCHAFELRRMDGLGNPLDYCADSAWHLTYPSGNGTQTNVSLQLPSVLDAAAPIPPVLPKLLEFLFVSLGLGILAMPCGNHLIIGVLQVLGPLTVAVTILAFLRWRIYGPVTGQALLLVYFGYNDETWYRVTVLSLLVAVVMRPFASLLGRTMHLYYRRSLTQAFFAGGKDTTWRQVRDNPFCPFLVFNATASDYMRPGDKTPISEIFFTCLHTGGPRTGYVATSTFRTIGRCMCLSGAATDAFILGLNDRLRYRFWLELLNMYMGDYVVFAGSWSHSARIASRLQDVARERLGRFVAGVDWAKLPSFLFEELNLVFLLRAAVVAARDCDSAVFLMSWVFCASLLLAVVSFFSFLPGVDMLLHSPDIRRLHRATRYYVRAERPPSLLYVTDGGVMDGLGVLQLLRRRCARILTVIALEDPADTLSGLRDVLRIAGEERLASFFDPSDARRDVQIMLDDFRDFADVPYLHLRICYGWRRTCAPEPGDLGDLFVVKLRMPEHMRDDRMKPLLTEDMILDSASGDAPVEEPVADVRQRDLGGCCCDCCHLAGCNCGPKFPHVSIANQFVTPQLFNSLCRLGFAASELAVDALAGAPPRPAAGPGARAPAPQGMAPGGAPGAPRPPGGGGA